MLSTPSRFFQTVATAERHLPLSNIALGLSAHLSTSMLSDMLHPTSDLIMRALCAWCDTDGLTTLHTFCRGGWGSPVLLLLHRLLQIFRGAIGPALIDPTLRQIRIRAFEFMGEHHVARTSVRDRNVSFAAGI